MNGPTRRSRVSRWMRTVGWRHAVGLVMGAFALFPLVYVLSTALAKGGTLTGSNRLFETFTLDNFDELLSSGIRPFRRWLVNTVIVGVGTALASVCLCAFAAYAFSRYRFRGRRMGLTTLVVVQLFPQLLGIVAIFLMLDSIGDAMPSLGLGTLPGLIAVYLGGALGLNAYLMYGYFNALPQELFDAAKLDGAGHFRTFWTILLPLVTPILVIVGMLVYISIAGDFVIASITLSDINTQTVPVGLYNVISTLRNDNWGTFCAGAVLTAIPVMALFLYAQRYIVSGLFSGSVK